MKIRKVHCTLSQTRQHPALFGIQKKWAGLWPETPGLKSGPTPALPVASPQACMLTGGWLAGCSVSNVLFYFYSNSFLLIVECYFNRAAQLNESFMNDTSLLATVIEMFHLYLVCLFSLPG